MKQKNKTRYVNTFLLFLKHPRLSWIKNKSSFYFFYPFLSCVLVSRWFYDHKLLATAEQGLHLYNAAKTYHTYSHLWLEIGLGTPSPFYIARIPYYAVLSLLSSIGLTNWLMECTLYVVALTIGFISIARLVKEVDEKTEWYLPHIVAFFYLFNLFVLSQVLIRFLDALLYSWAFLPLFLLLWIKWIKTNRYYYLLGLLGSSLIFSSIFTLVSSLFLLWIPAAVYVFVALLTLPNKKKILFFSLLGFILWIVTNSWWLLPVWQLKDNTYAELRSTTNNVTVVAEVSKYYPLSELGLLRQKYFFGPNGPWGDMYLSNNYYVVSYLILFFCLIGVITSLKQKRNYYFIALFFVGFFLVKGTNPPFGTAIYNFLFSYIPVSQVLRNPYEKLGLLFVLPYIIFVTIGLTTVIKIFKRDRILILLSFLCVCCIFLVWPITKRDLFPVSYRMIVPEYYHTASRYIQTKSSNRIFHLPYLKGSAVTYDWGYRGEEPSELLFENVSLAKISNVPSMDEHYFSLEKYLTYPDFPKLLALVNINTIVTHTEYVSEVNKPNLVDESKYYISLWKNITPPHTIGKLDINFITQYKSPGLFYTVNNIIPVNSVLDGNAEVLKPSFSLDTSIFILKKDMSSLVSAQAKLLQHVVLRYKKISNEKYVIDVENAKKPFLVVFSMNYNPKWHMIIDKRIVTEHSKVNGYGNGWLVNKQGNFTMEISFK